MRSLRFLYWLCVFLFTSGFLGFCSPMAIIKADKQSGTAPLTVQFDASRSFCFTSAIVGYQWDFDSNGTIDAEGISTTYIYSTPGAFTAKLIVRDAKGHESIATKSITVASPISLNIVSPANGENITQPMIMLKGTFTNVNGTETGITVNGVPVNVCGNNFTMDRIVLQDGENTITAKATDTQGYTAETSIMVNAIIPQKYIDLAGDPVSGTSPLETRLKLSGTFNYVNPEITYSGPLGGQVEINPETEGGYAVKLTGEGLYYFTASAMDDEGALYTDTIGISVMSKADLDSLLGTKLNDMKQSLTQNDIEAVLNYFSSTTKEKHRAILNEFTPEQCAELVQLLNDAQFVGMNGNNRIEYDVRVVRDSKEYSYLLVFEKDADGLWKIRSF